MSMGTLFGESYFRINPKVAGCLCISGNGVAVRGVEGERDGATELVTNIRHVHFSLSTTLTSLGNSLPRRSFT